MGRTGGGARVGRRSCEGAPPARLRRCRVLPQAREGQDWPYQSWTPVRPVLSETLRLSVRRAELVLWLLETL